MSVRQRLCHVLQAVECFLLVVVAVVVVVFLRQ